MKLSSFKNSKNQTFNNSKVESFFKCKLYYAYYGRNAWHSTWITRYEEGSICTSLESAKEYVEIKRVQGSIFYIVEIPALVYKSVRGFLVITEINTDETLKGYNHFSSIRVDLIGEPKMIVNGVLNDKIKDIATSFEPFSNNWIGRNRYKDSVQILATCNKNIEFEKYEKNKSYRFSSYSIGVDYSYMYHKIKDKKNDKHIDQIIENSTHLGLINSNFFKFYLSIIYKSNRSTNRDGLLEESNKFYDKLNQINSPKKGIIWINDNKNTLKDEDYDDIVLFLKKNKLQLKQKYFDFSFFIKKPYKKVVLSLFYPLNFLTNLVEEDSYQTEKILEHLKLILIRLKIRSKFNEKILLIFYDKFMNSRIFVFSLNSSKEDLISSISELPVVISESFYSYNNEIIKEDYSSQIYHDKEGDWQWKQSKNWTSII